MRQLTALLCLLCAATSGHAADLRDRVGVATPAHVVRVVDGDTVDVVPQGERVRIRVRLEGIDTPERGEPFSTAATRYTRSLVFDQDVTVDGRDVDRYDRLVARVGVGGVDASVVLVQAGLACHFTRYSSDPALAAAEAQARREGRGFWADGAPKPRCTMPHRSTRRAP